MTGVFLQVRINSSRLPGKAILPLGDLTVIEHAMRALKAVSADTYALLTDYDSASRLEHLASRWDYELFAGDPDNVLKRYTDAVKYFGVDTVVRATGDNPLVSGFLANSILDYHFQRNADYSGFTGIPVGTGVEVLRAETLLEAGRLAADPYELEHVSPYLYFREKEFNINRVPAPGEYYFPEGRVTLDTADDYAVLKRLFQQQYKGQPVEIQSVILWLRTHMPQEYYAAAL